MPRSIENAPAKEPAMVAALFRFARSTGVVERADNADRFAKAEGLDDSVTGLSSLAIVLWRATVG